MNQWDIVAELPEQESQNIEPASAAPHQLIANPEAVDAAVLAGIDTNSMFDWHHIRTDLQPIIGVDLKALDMSPASPLLVPHPAMLAKLLEIFEEDLPPQSHLDEHARAKHFGHLWYFQPTEEILTKAEERLKEAGPRLEFVGQPPQLRLTQLGERKQLLEFVRARFTASLDVFGRKIIANWSL